MNCENCDHKKICMVRRQGMAVDCSEWDGWVEEKDPEKNGPYLIKTKNGHRYVAKYFSFHGWNGSFKDSVVAWRELPK